MKYYQIYGKWFHLEYSDYFCKVIEASSPREALQKLAESLSQEFDMPDLEWLAPLPDRIRLGVIDSEPSFMIGDDQIYQVRKISEVRPVETTCSHCAGTGRTTTYRQ